MDILYVYKSNKNGDLELKYSLRSIDSFAVNVGNVYIVGDKPDYLSDKVIHIPHKSKFGAKEKNIADAIKYALDNSDISDDFLLSSDDHFYCNPVDFDNYPYYRNINEPYNGEIPVLMKKGSSYRRQLVVTGAILRENNLPCNMFAIHKNRHISRKYFNKAYPIIKSARKSEYGVESVLVSLNYQYSKKPFKFVDSYDCKLNVINENTEELIKDVDCFSTIDFEEGSDFHIFLDNKYNNKSKYEL